MGRSFRDDIQATKTQEKALTRSARLSVELFGRIAGSSFPATAGILGSQNAIFRQFQSTARQLASTLNPAASRFESALAAADRAAAERLLRLAETIGQVPEPETGVDPYTRGVIATTEDDLRRLVTEQNRQTDRADKYGARSSRAVFGLSLLALSAVLLGLAAVVGAKSGGALLLGAAAVALLLAGGWGASAFLI